MHYITSALRRNRTAPFLNNHPLRLDGRTARGTTLGAPFIPEKRTRIGRRREALAMNEKRKEKERGEKSPRAGARGEEPDLRGYVVREEARGERNGLG